MPRLRILIITLTKLFFAAIPLSVNAVVWGLLPASVGWPLINVDDLTYFTLTFGADMMLVALLFLPAAGQGRTLVLFIAPLLALAGSSVVFGFWRHDAADPKANMLFAQQMHNLIWKSAVCAATALVFGIGILWCSRAQFNDVPSHSLFFAGRLVIAVVPCMLDAIASSGPITWGDFLHTGDICFFAIAMSGPAMLDIVHRRRLEDLSEFFALLLLIVIAWSSVLLGFWYFETALPRDASGDPAVRDVILKGLTSNAIVCAILAASLATIVHFRRVADPHHCLAV
jgi:hypothetical protein